MRLILRGLFILLFSVDLAEAQKFYIDADVEITLLTPQTTNYQVLDLSTPYEAELLGISFIKRASSTDNVISSNVQVITPSIAGLDINLGYQFRNYLYLELCLGFNYIGEYVGGAASALNFIAEPNLGLNIGYEFLSHRAVKFSLDFGLEQLYFPTRGGDIIGEGIKLAGIFTPYNVLAINKGELSDGSFLYEVEAEQALFAKHRQVIMGAIGLRGQFRDKTIKFNYLWNLNPLYTEDFFVERRVPQAASGFSLSYSQRIISWKPERKELEKIRKLMSN